jgi:type III pantothenate kinase
MILCLDCGNTRLKWGLHSGSAWIATGALPTGEAGSLGGRLPPTAALDHVIGCMVAAPAVGLEIEAALPVRVNWIQARDQQCGVTSRYENPKSLGADRWAALLGARRIHGAACVVVSAGTATTIDLLDAAGIFQGGLIMPGLDMMRSALADNTARLPGEPGHYRKLPRNTHDAIFSGAVFATLGAIDGMFSLIAREAGACCVLSGGAAEILTKEIDLPHLRVDNLALEGLARIATESGGGA